MAIRTIDMARLQPTGRQWAQNAIMGIDPFNKIALMPLKKHKPPNIPKEWGKYVDTCTTPTYQIDVYQCHLELKIGGKTTPAGNSHGPDSNPMHFFKLALYEKTLMGNVFIALRNNSEIIYINEKNEETSLPSSGLDGEIENIVYAFNRLVVSTSKSVFWSPPGLNPPDNQKMNFFLNKKQSDTSTQRYLGCHSDSKNLYLFTEDGYHVWSSTQDADQPFIHVKSVPGRVVDFDSRWCLMETDEHGLGIFDVQSERFLTDERWTLRPEDVRDMKSFRLAQNGSKLLAIYEEKAAWLLDSKFGLVTKTDAPFYPHQEAGESYMDMQINMLLDKGVYGSLLMQLGQFPEEIQFYVDNFYMKRAPLLAFERDDVIKTTNIGKLTVDTPLELNFKGFASIYSLGIEQPAGE